MFKFPSTLNPTAIMDVPRRMKLESGPSRGQLRWKYGLKRESSETMRKIAIVLVTKCETPSKKKNCAG